MTDERNGHRPALPPGWAWSTLGELCGPVASVVPARDMANQGLFKYVDLGAISDQRIVAPQELTPAEAPSRARQLIGAGDTVLSCVRVYLENVARVPNELHGAVASTAFAVLRPRTGVDPAYLYWLVRRPHFIRSMVEKQRGNSPPAVLEVDVKAAKVPVAPASEQARIVARIDELFGEIEIGEQELQKAHEGLENYRRAVLRAAVTGELTKDWREKYAPNETGADLLRNILLERRMVWTQSGAKGAYAEPISPDVHADPPMPVGWIWASLGQLTKVMTSGSRAWSQYYGRGESVFVMAQNVRPGRFDMTFIQRVDPPGNDVERRRTLVRKDDILVTIVGANTGDACRVDRQVHDHFVCQSVALLRPVLGETSRYLELYLAADDGGQRQFRRHIYGAGRPHLSFDQLKSVMVPLPPPDEISELLTRCTDILTDCDDLRTAVEEAACAIGNLRQSVMSDAFSGRLVPQNPNDEPASELLTRLRATNKTVPVIRRTKPRNLQEAAQ